MKAKILIKNIVANNQQDAERIIKKEYPRAKLITYKFNEDFKFVPMDERKYRNREMRVAFIDNVELIREAL